MSQTGAFKTLHAQTQPNRLERLMYFISRRWLMVLGIALGVYSGLPFLAPVFMKLGWETPAQAIYFIYSFLCHQLPQRSYFLFGSKFTYSLAEIQSAWQNTNEIMTLRQFIGNSIIGWKVAWSDRMVSMFISLWLFCVVWGSLRRWLKPLPLWGLMLLILPLAVDGTSHLISDLAGIGQGFRDSNVWLAAITGNAFPPHFYAGDAWGSFNSIMRLLTGVLFGLGLGWFGLPYFDSIFSYEARLLAARIKPYKGSYLERR